MSRPLCFALSVVLLAFSASVAPASFLFLLPDTTVGGKFSLVFHSTPFSDTPPDGGKLGVQAVTGLSDAGKRTQVPTQKEVNCTTAKVDGDTAFTSVDYGVSNRGEGQLVLLRFHAKAQPVGGSAVGQSLELTPARTTAGVVFVATAGGKPLNAATVTVCEPGGGEPRTVTTDADGRTPEYSTPGRYAVRVGRFETVKGEHEGRAYTGVWEYSTLVTTVK
jgi:hypothetical protein